jgi:hypothetical protein
MYGCIPDSNLSVGCQSDSELCCYFSRRFYPLDCPPFRVRNTDNFLAADIYVFFGPLGIPGTLSVQTESIFRGGSRFPGVNTEGVALLEGKLRPLCKKDINTTKYI